MVADTCVAMDEWVQHPTARTALDDILPCVDNATAQQTLIQSQNVTYQLAVVVNTMITKIANANVPPTPRLPIYYNQSGPLMPVLCNPFYSNLTSRTCATGEVELSKAPEVIPLTQYWNFSLEVHKYSCEGFWSPWKAWFKQILYRVLLLVKVIIFGNFPLVSNGPILGEIIISTWWTSDVVHHSTKKLPFV